MVDYIHDNASNEPPSPMPPQGAEPRDEQSEVIATAPPSEGHPTEPPPPEPEPAVVPAEVHEAFKAEAVAVIQHAEEQIHARDEEILGLRSQLRAAQVNQKAYAFVFVDLTTSATPDNLRPAQAFPQVIDALVEYLSTDYARAYGGRTISFRVASGPGDRAPGEIAVNHRDTTPEAPGALAYHTVTGGVADIELAMDLFDGLTGASDSYDVGLVHEVIELLGDEGANGWKDRQDASGLSDAEEDCDFVQNTFKTMSNGVNVSNFVLPSFFIPGAPGPWDNMGVMASRDDVSHGYGIVATTPSDPHQVSAARLLKKEIKREVRHVGTLSELGRKRKAHPYSRAFRRGVRL